MEGHHTPFFDDWNSEEWAAHHSMFSSEEALDPIQEQHEPNSPSTGVTVWRCLRCGSRDHVASNSWWLCTACGHDDFYQVDKTVKTMTQEGTWVYMPKAQSSPESSSSRRRRRRKLLAAHGDGSPDGDNGDDGEWAESEARTQDPAVDPDEFDHQALLADHGHLPDAGRALLPGSGRLQGSPRALQQDHLPSGPTASSDPMLRALKELVQRKDDGSTTSWNSRKGPEKGIRWKTGTMPTVPVWRYDPNDLRSFAKFEKKVRIWQLQMKTYAPPKDQALLLYNGLTGEPEQELEHIDLSEIYHDQGVDRILELLKTPLEQRAVYQKRKFLADFENSRRYNNESMRAFVSRFRRCFRNLKSLGIDITGTYDQESLGSRLLDRSGLSVESQRGILIGTQQSLNFELIAETLVLQYPEFRAPPPLAYRDGPKGSGKSTSSGSSSSSSSTAAPSTRSSFSGKSGPRRVYVTEADNGEEALEPIDEEGADGDDNDRHEDPQDDPLGDQQQDDQDQSDDDDLGLQELAQVLTVTARKLSGVTLGRKFTSKMSNSKKKSPEELKKVTHCMACGQRGHWAGDPECSVASEKFGGKAGGKAGGKHNSSKPVDKKSTAYSSASKQPSTHSVNVVHHHEHGSVTFTDDDRYGHMFQVNMMMHYVPMFDVNHVNNNPCDFNHYMILDSACQRSCCGRQWYHEFTTYISQYNMFPKVISCDDVFQFGKGTPSYADQRAYLPCLVNGTPLLLGAAILPETIPFLGSNQLLKQLVAVIDLTKNEVKFAMLGDGVVKLHQLGGHLAIDIFDLNSLEVAPSRHEAWKVLSQPEVWQAPHPELILPDFKQTQNSQPRVSQTHEIEPAVVAGQMAEDGAGPDVLWTKADRPHGEGHSPQDVLSSMVGGQHSAVRQPHGHEPGRLQASTRDDQALRQLKGKVCQVSNLPDRVEVEQNNGNMGRTQRSPARSLVSKLFGTVVAIATAFIN